MNKNLLKDLINLKLKTIDTIIDSLPVESDNNIRKGYDDFIDVLNETTGNYINERKVSSTKSKQEKGIKKIEIE